MSGLVLWNYWRSSASWRVRIGLGLKGLAFEYRAVHLLKDGGEQRGEAHRARNPMAQIPVLQLGADDRTAPRLSQSLAILEYLDETHPEPPLLPREPFARARVRQLAELVNSGIQPLQNLIVLDKVKELGGDPKTWSAFFIARGLDALEIEARAGKDRFLAGPVPTLADVCLVPQIYNARRFGADPAAWPRLLEIEAACSELPAFQAAHPDRQPDAAP